MVGKGLHPRDVDLLALVRAAGVGARVPQRILCLFAAGLGLFLLGQLDVFPIWQCAPHEEEFALPPGFAVPDDFPGAVRALEGLAGTAAHPLVVLDSLGDSVTTPGVEVAVRWTLVDSFVEVSQPPFLAKGFYLFHSAQNFNLEQQLDRVALYPSPDLYVVLRLIGTNGWNYDIGPDSVERWLRALERDQPFVITGVGYDWVAGRFAGPIRDPRGLAGRFYRFCPDIVEQGTGTVEALARELRRTGSLYCWWD